MATTDRRKSDLTWATLLASAVSGDPEPVPDGWLTVPQLVHREKIPSPTLKRRLKRLLSAGKVERKSFRLKVKDGRLMPIAHYRMCTCTPRGI